MSELDSYLKQAARKLAELDKQMTAEVGFTHDLQLIRMVHELIKEQNPKEQGANENTRNTASKAG